MNFRKKHYFEKCVFFVFVGWLMWFRSVDASQMFFPFIADDWISFEIQTPAISCGDLETINISLVDKAKNNTANNTENSTKKKNTETKKSKKTKKSSETDETEKTALTMAQVTEKNTQLSDSEKEMLYKVVSMECDTGYDGSLAVISCMLNRQESAKYPNDLIDVIQEDSQFTAYYDKETGTYPYLDREPSEECIAAVDDALNEGKRNIPSYILYFRSSDYDYLKGYETYGQIGDNTYFYKNEDVNH